MLPYAKRSARDAKKNGLLAVLLPSRNESNSTERFHGAWIC